VVPPVHLPVVVDGVGLCVPLTTSLLTLVVGIILGSGIAVPPVGIQLVTAVPAMMRVDAAVSLVIITSFDVIVLKCV
jgi:hypothetical protein